MFELGLKFSGGDPGRRGELRVAFEGVEGNGSPRPDSMNGHTYQRKAEPDGAAGSASFAEEDLITGQLVPCGRRFFPVSYSCEDLVEEAEALVDASLASWLAEQPEAVFEEIMEGTGWRIWGGAGYLAALTEALLEAREWSEPRAGM